MKLKHSYFLTDGATHVWLEKWNGTWKHLTETLRSYKKLICFISHNIELSVLTVALHNLVLAFCSFICIESHSEYFQIGTWHSSMVYLLQKVSASSMRRGKGDEGVSKKSICSWIIIKCPVLEFQNVNVLFRSVNQVKLQCSIYHSITENLSLRS